MSHRSPNQSVRITDVDNTPHDCQIKILMLGDSGVGKSSLMVRFAEGTFANSYMSTIGVDYKTRYVDVSNKKIKVCIWDTAGQERFRTITQSFYRGAHGIVLVYGCDDRKSFESLTSWVNANQEAAPSAINMILANKCDCSDAERQVPKSEGEEFAAKLRCGFMECSAKEGIDVDQAFLDLATKCYHSGNFQMSKNAPLLPGRTTTDLDDVMLTGGGKKKKKCCG